MLGLCLCCFLGLIESNAVMAQTGERYAQPVFDEVTVTEGIPFSSALRLGATEPTTLYLDFYEPMGDTLAERWKKSWRGRSSVGLPMQYAFLSGSDNFNAKIKVILSHLQ